MRINKIWQLVYLVMGGLLLVLPLVASGCLPGDKSPVLSDPFKTSMGYFSIEGYARGYLPGQTYDFDVTLNNTTEETWQTTFHVFLVDTKTIVLNIAEQPISLNPGSTIVTRVKMALPADLREGPYGLSIIFPGQGASITTIHIGSDQDQPAGNWYWPEVTPLPGS